MDANILQYLPAPDWSSLRFGLRVESRTSGFLRKNTCILICPFYKQNTKIATRSFQLFNLQFLINFQKKTTSVETSLVRDKNG